MYSVDQDIGLAGYVPPEGLDFPLFNFTEPGEPHLLGCRPASTLPAFALFHAHSSTLDGRVHGDYLGFDKYYMNK
jgi:hypothetical protein